MRIEERNEMKMGKWEATLRQAFAMLGASVNSIQNVDEESSPSQDIMDKLARHQDPIGIVRNLRRIVFTDLDGIQWEYYLTPKAGGDDGAIDVAIYIHHALLKNCNPPPKFYRAPILIN